MEATKESSIMSAHIARQRTDNLLKARTGNLLISIEKKIEEAIDRCVSTTEITNEECKYCEKKLIEAGYKITEDGGDFWIDW